jgi:hypothetical protein
VQWSPQQIAGWLKRTYPGNEDYQVSHETIYRSLFIQARGALKKELLEHLRRTRAMRRSRHHTQKTDDRGRIRDTVSISERPATVEDRAVPGHWEGDLLCGSGSSQIATLVERQTRYVMLVKVASKDASLRPMLTRRVQPYLFVCVAKSPGHGIMRRGLVIFANMAPVPNCKRQVIPPSLHASTAMLVPRTIKTDPMAQRCTRSSPGRRDRNVVILPEHIATKPLTDANAMINGWSLLPS